MPAYNFMRQFAPNVIAGLAWYQQWDVELTRLVHEFNVSPCTLPKRQTIRAHRKRQTKPGEILYLYTGMRTKNCINLGEAVCRTVARVQLERWEETKLLVKWPDAALPMPNSGIVALDHWAQLDGFAGVNEMLNFFGATHGLPFEGELITW